MATSSQSTAAAVPYEQIKWQIAVDGKAIKRILSFKLEQRFSAHHSFELRLYHTEIEDPRAYRIDKSKELLGKGITVILGTQLDADLNRFGGVITEVGFEEANGIYGVVILKGYSPTVFLESGPHMRSFYNRNLSGITGDIAGMLKGKLDVAIQPRFGSNIEYSVQHQESHFAFLNRISAACGEWFYYDGEKLVLGRPSNQPTFDLQYVRHLQNLKMNLQVVPMSFTHIAYQPQNNQSLTKYAPQNVDGLDYYGDLAVRKSDEFYKDTAVKATPWQHAGDPGTLDRITTVNKGAAAAQTFAIEAESRHPAPRPGARIRIMFGDTELGEYVVTEAVHNLDNVNAYSCVFKALPADIEVMPATNLQVPHSDTQIATVVKNEDPAGMGRVRVQFQWQEGDSMTPWLRVMTPDAGGSGAVMQNRGFVFVPEIGDQVVVDFEEGNPDAPFVLGSLFHGGNGQGQSNMVRTIMTKSGNKIVMNDTEGSILVTDPSGNHWHLDGQGNIHVTAPNNFTVNAGGNIELSAGANISSSAGANQFQSAGANMAITSGLMLKTTVGSNHLIDVQGDSTEIIKGDFKSDTKSRTEVASKGYNITSSDDKVVVKASDQIEKHSGEKSKTS